MTEPEDLDEDFFADLYENDDVPQQPAVVSPPPVEQKRPSSARNNAAPDMAFAPPTIVQSNSNPGQYNNANNYSYNNNSNGTPDAAFHANTPQNAAAAPPNEHGFTGTVGIKEDGKMFIGGLNWETTDQSLRDYFSQFGEVLECTVMRDGASGRSRGFGFLTFKDPKTVNIVMVKEHFLDGKIIDPKRAIPRDEQDKTAKIFVGGVSQDATERDFEGYFAQFGRVIDATLMMDKDTGRPRGFGFVTFEGEAAVEATLAQPLEILGKPIEVKRAQPRGNIREEEENNSGGRGGGKYGRKGHNDRFQQRSQQENHGSNDNNQQQMQAQQDGQGTNTMSPQMMAQYWTRMQQYFAMMQQSMAAGMGPGGQSMPGAGGMNPMQQQAMMQAMMNGGMNQTGSPGPQSPGQQMNPAMMQQMQQQMQQQQMAMQQGQAQGQGQGQSPAPEIQRMMSPNGSGSDAGGANRPGFNAQEQLAFEQRKYEQQQARRMGGGGGGGAAGGGGGGAAGGNQQYGRQGYGGGGPTSWEGMYDDVPQPNMAGGGGGGRNRNRGNQNAHQQTPQNTQAPANAPTGPKNAGKPGANYRGGGGGGRSGHRGYHPYARN